MIDNIENLLIRGEKIEDLSNAASEIENTAKEVQRKATKLSWIQRLQNLFKSTSDSMEEAAIAHYTS
jgi:hypothetical protein